MPYKESADLENEIESNDDESEVGEVPDALKMESEREFEDNSDLDKETMIMGQVSSPEHATPEKSQRLPWNEEYFTSPMCGNSGPPRHEITEMCMALMQYLSDVHPDILKSLAL